VMSIGKGACCRGSVAKGGNQPKRLSRLQVRSFPLYFHNDANRHIAADASHLQNQCSSPCSYLQARQSFRLISAFCNASPAAGAFSTPPSNDCIPTCALSSASPAFPSDAFAVVVFPGRVSVGGSSVYHVADQPIRRKFTSMRTTITMKSPFPPNRVPPLNRQH
jgi:hypothetical protein